MLLKTKIKDFQSLHDVEIEHGGVTIITGQSDLGKSAILRSIKTLHRNCSTVTDIKHGAHKFSVEQTFDDGNVISIEKSKTVNSYHVNGQTLAKVGREVPEMVREILKTDELVLDKDLSCDLNFSGQFDPQFLLTESSTFVTKVISTLSGIEIIYAAIREGAAQAQKLKATSQILSGNIEGLLKFVGLQSDAVGLQSELAGLQYSEKESTTLSETIEKLGSLSRRGEVLKAKVIDVAPEEEALKTLSETYKALISGQSKIDALEVLKKRSESIKILDIEPVEALLSKIKTIYSVLEGDEIVYNTLILRHKTITDFGNKIEEADRIIAELEAEEAKLKISVKICGACGRPL